MTFYEPGRLLQDAQRSLEIGFPVFAVAHMIVVPVITQEAMIRAIDDLAAKGFEDLLGPE